jgi:phytoene dehydrogenase-like protein
MIPTLIDPTMTPPGKHFMSCFVQYAPPKIEGRDWTDADRDGFRDACLNQIENLRARLQVAGPALRGAHPRELEAEVGLTEGNIFQGELTFDQMFFNRPVPGYANYRSPIRTCGCAGRRPTPAAGSWARRAATQRRKCCAT